MWRKHDHRGRSWLFYPENTYTTRQAWIYQKVSVTRIQTKQSGQEVSGED